MKNNRFNKTGKLFLMTLVFLVSANFTASGQAASSSPYVLEQSVIAGGGGTSQDAGNQFSIIGSIGQSITDAGNAAPFTIKSGFFTAPPGFAPSAALVTIGGRAITSTGRGIRSVFIRLTSADGKLDSRERPPSAITDLQMSTRAKLHYHGKRQTL